MPRSASTRARRAALAGVGLAALLLGAMPAAAQTLVAILEFTNASPERADDPLGKGLQSMLTTDLSQVPGLVLVERQRLRDIQSELKLGQSGQIDKQTAARIGKLAGAGYLLGGSFVIIGKRMRIDSRLFAVQSGQIAYADKIEGERDAFFELEKQLAGKLVEVAGIHLAPRERASLAKVQTADFEAFRKYSQGLAAFDDKRYQDALTALGDAARIDKDFRLAATTLEEYVRLIGKLRDKADAADSERDLESERRAQREQAQHSEKWAQAIEELWKLASASGGGQAQQDRLAATLLLSLGYDHEFQLRFPRGDTFALERLSDDLARRYAAEARPLFPRVPPLAWSDGWLSPERGEAVPAWVRRTYAHLEELMKPTRAGRVVETMLRELHNCHAPDYSAMATRLQLDHAQTVRLAEQLVAWADQLQPKEQWPKRTRQFLAGLYTEGLELNKSTALWAEESAATKSSYELRNYANEIERNRQLLDLLQSTKHPELTREVLTLEGYNAREVVSKFLATTPPAPELWRYLAGFRVFPRSGFVYIGQTPLWLARAGHDSDVQTGARSDARRATELRYVPDPDYRRFNPGYDCTPEALVMVDGRPRQDQRVTLELRYAVPPELEAHGRNGPPPPRGRAEVGWAFGVQNALGQAQPSGYALLLDGKAARLVRFELVKDKDASKVNNQRTHFRTQVIEEHPLAFSGERVPLTVVLKGARLEARAAGHSATFNAPAERNGFQGLLFRELAYAAVADIKLGAP